MEVMERVVVVRGERRWKRAVEEKRCIYREGQWDVLTA